MIVALFSGVIAERIPIKIPIELGFANPQMAYVAIAEECKEILPAFLITPSFSKTCVTGCIFGVLFTVFR